MLREFKLFFKKGKVSVFINIEVHCCFNNHSKITLHTVVFITIKHLSIHKNDDVPLIVAILKCSH